MTYRLSARSERTLAGVHGDLEAWVRRLIQITPIDFVVLEGLRTPERQAELISAGASQTMKSRHITGHAVDLGAWLGTVRWELPLYCQIAQAGREAALDLGIPIRWGGCWQRLDLTAEAPETMVSIYIADRLDAGKRPFVDSGHFELPETRYPT